MLGGCLEIPVELYKKLAEKVLFSFYEFTMEFSLKTLGFFLTVVLCALLRHAHLGESVYIPTRCVCLDTMPSFPEKLIRDFSITEKGPHCRTDEIIIVTQKNVEVCLNAEEKQGQNLLKCWNRINKDEDKKLSCLKRRKPHNK